MSQGIQLIKSNLWLSTALIISLLPVLMTPYFLTNDGPSHVYNAALLKDQFLGHSSELVSSFFRINPFPVPNYISYFFIASLLQFFSPHTAEKIFILVYSTGFISSLYYLIICINPNARALIMASPLLVFHRTFMMGFYNFSFAFIFLFLSLGLLWKNRYRWKRKDLLLFFFSNMLLYFSHPVPLVLLVVFSAIHYLFFLVRYGKQHTIANPFIYLGQLALSISPALILLLLYLLQRGFSGTTTLMDSNGLWKELYNADSLWIFNLFENRVMQVFVLILIVSLIFSIVMNRHNLIYEHFNFISLFTITIFLYFLQPVSIAGGEMTPFRLQFAIFCMLFLSLVLVVNTKLTNRIALFLGLLALTVNIPRVFFFKKISEVSENIEHSFSNITANSVVLPLIFNIKGADASGKTASDAWLFAHCYDYVGVTIPVVLLGNYEAATSYFPIEWNSDMDPFPKLKCTDSYIHSFSPCANIESYNAKTGDRIDYITVLFENASQEALSEETKSMLRYIEANYQLVYSVNNKQVQIYKRNQ